MEPVLESILEPVEHLLFEVFDVSELGPTSNIAAFRRTLDLHDKLFHQPQLVRVFFPQMPFADVRGLFLSVLGPKTHIGGCLSGRSSRFCPSIFNTAERFKFHQSSKNVKTVVTLP